MRSRPGGVAAPLSLPSCFAQPDSDAIRMLDVRGEYFDVKTGTPGTCSFLATTDRQGAELSSSKRVLRRSDVALELIGTLAPMASMISADMSSRRRGDDGNIRAAQTWC